MSLRVRTPASLERVAHALGKRLDISFIEEPELAEAATPCAKTTSSRSI